MKKYLAFGVICLALLGGGIYWHTRSNDKSGSTVHTTSKAATAQSNFSKGASRPTSSGSASQGGAIDNKGVTPENVTGPSTVSSSGLLTLQQPSTNATVKTGDSLFGLAQIQPVQYRLVDDQVGVLAQGSLSVVDGKFSGKLQFTSHGTTGKLDIFSFDPQSGAEINRIEIKVVF